MRVSRAIAAVPRAQLKKMTTVESSFDAMAIVQEMIVCLNNAEEPKLVAEIREKQSELRRLHDKQQQELKDIVSGKSISEYILNISSQSIAIASDIFFFLTVEIFEKTAYSGKINKLKATIEKEEARIVRTAQETKEIERKQDAVRDEM
jgi:hypothetical protein